MHLVLFFGLFWTSNLGIFGLSFLIRTLQQPHITRSVTAKDRRPNVQLYIHASDGKDSVYNTLFARDFAAMGSYSINPRSRFPDHSAELTEEDCISKALSALL